MSKRQHTPGPYIVRGEIEPDSPDYAMGAEPALEEGAAPRDCGWPYFIREDREFPLGSGPLWLAHGIQRKADADLFAAAPEMLAALKDLEPYAAERISWIKTTFPESRWPETRLRQWEAVLAAISAAEGRA